MKLDKIISNLSIQSVVEQNRRESIVKNPLVDERKKQRYIYALSKAKQFFVGDRGKIIFDDINMPYDHHTMTIMLYDDEFDGQEVTRLCEIINSFDGLLFYGSSKGDISIQLTIYDIYYERQT